MNSSMRLLIVLMCLVGVASITWQITNPRWDTNACEEVRSSDNTIDRSLGSPNPSTQIKRETPLPKVGVGVPGTITKILPDMFSFGMVEVELSPGYRMAAIVENYKPIIVGDHVEVHNICFTSWDGNLYAMPFVEIHDHH